MNELEEYIRNQFASWNGVDELTFNGSQIDEMIGICECKDDDTESEDLRDAIRDAVSTLEHAL